MSEICSKCGLPKEICACENIAKESQRIKVYIVKKKFNKINTIIEGLDSRDIDIKKLAKRLKSEFACGGTSKQGNIELQGDHKAKVKSILIKMGYPQETIDVV
ncbi:stress response translation initiation inhibitor YciH [Candidatus Woesearchaeota archaeon CG10_big_fil_rev_8_21_14_0_10_47_5]|nr:MAG: translation initiation factor [Candidatus Woesearchaeota archaeon CG1_02_47_18]PIN72272.1 MAG: stress response translation initiation inhibitor YciH [Candidatus Woesearchaeota archaeon CG10_big_fil_rev_8_21_14_0_10_47_5]